MTLVLTALVTTPGTHLVGACLSPDPTRVTLALFPPGVSPSGYDPAAFAAAEFEVGTWRTLAAPRVWTRRLRVPGMFRRGLPAHRAPGTYTLVAFTDTEEVVVMLPLPPSRDVVG